MALPRALVATLAGVACVSRSLASCPPCPSPQAVTPSPGPQQARGPVASKTTKESLEHDIEGLEKAIADAEEALATAKTELGALEDGHWATARQSGGAVPSVTYTAVAAAVAVALASWLWWQPPGTLRGPLRPRAEVAQLEAALGQQREQSAMLQAQVQQLDALVKQKEALLRDAMTQQGKGSDGCLQGDCSAVLRTPTGICWHVRRNCPGLNKAREVTTVSKATAVAAGLRSCSLCGPGQ